MSDEKRIGNWTQTYTGKRFYPIDPRAEDVCIEDIAHALSMICRFNGHLKFWYPVAMHSVHVSRLVPKEHALAALLHDASEAYICDMPAPLKGEPEMEGYRLIDHNISRAIREKFEIVSFEESEIMRADRVALSTEVRDLIINPIEAKWTEEPSDLNYKCEPCNPKQAKDTFIRRFEEIGVEAAQIAMF